MKRPACIRKEGNTMSQFRVLFGVVSCSALTLWCSTAVHADPLGTSFTYQGQLKEGGVPFTGKADFTFTVWDALSGGASVAGPQVKAEVAVAGGLFTVELDFGAAAFDGDARYLEVGVRTPAWDGQGTEPPFVALDPRQPVSPSPYAMQTRGLFVDDTGRIGVGTTSPSVETTLELRADPDNFGVLVESVGAAGSEIGLHSGPAGYASLVKNAFFAPGWKRFDDTKGAFLQEVFPTGETRFHVTPPGADYINWSNPLTLMPDGATVVNGFLGVGRSTKAHPTEYFGVQAPIDTGFGGMYVQTNGTGAAPFYGYSAGGTLAYHYLDGADENKWKLNLNGTHLTVTQTGRVGIGTTDPQDRLHVVGDSYLQGMIQAEGNILAGGFVRSGLGLTLDGGAHRLSSEVDLELHVGNGRALRLEDNAQSPNLVGGYSGNGVSAVGATVGGGGAYGLANFVSGNYGTIGGGASNTAGGDYSAVPGGLGNEALGAYSFAAGRGAQANHDGSFVWKDGTEGAIASTGVDQFIISAGGGVGINTNAPTHALSVTGSADFTGSVGIGDTTPDARLDVQRNFSPVFPIGAVAVFNRTGTDGHILDFQQDDVTEGWISVSGNTVSYNAFTGSHLAWTDETLERGTLVRLTGENRHLHEGEGAEPVYGIARSTRANDPACLGSYLGREPMNEGDTADDHHLVMAVGNGDLCVVDTGHDIEPGDLLVSSDVGGCAMLDDPVRFDRGYVIARAAERVHWQGEPKRDGHRYKRISVLFGGFVRDGVPSSVERMRALVDRTAAQEARILTLENELATLRKSFARLDGAQRSELLRGHMAGVAAPPAP